MLVLLPDHSPLSTMTFDPLRAPATNDDPYARETHHAAAASTIPSFAIVAGKSLEDAYQFGGYAGI